MKLLVAIVQDYDADRLLRGLTSAGFRVTRIASVGGFLRSANTTLLIGIHDEQLVPCLELIKRVCGLRTQSIGHLVEELWIELEGVEVSQDAHGGAVVLILRVDRFERIYPLPATIAPPSMAGR